MNATDPITTHLRDARLEAGMSLEDLSEATLIAVRQLSRYERGEQLPPRARRLLIARTVHRRTLDLWPEAAA